MPTPPLGAAPRLRTAPWGPASPALGPWLPAPGSCPAVQLPALIYFLAPEAPTRLVAARAGPEGDSRVGPLPARGRVRPLPYLSAEGRAGMDWGLIPELSVQVARFQQTLRPPRTPWPLSGPPASKSFSSLTFWLLQPQRGPTSPGRAFRETGQQGKQSTCAPGTDAGSRLPPASPTRVLAADDVY